MNNLNTLQAYANKSVLVDKTRLTNYTTKRNGSKETEQRLWVWFTGSNNPMLIKKHWLSGDDKRDLSKLYHEFLKI